MGRKREGEKRGGILGLREQGDGDWRWGHRIVEAPNPVQTTAHPYFIEPRCVVTFKVQGPQ